MNSTAQTPRANQFVSPSSPALPPDAVTHSTPPRCQREACSIVPSGRGEETVVVLARMPLRVAVVEEVDGTIPTLPRQKTSTGTFLVSDRRYGNMIRVETGVAGVVVVAETAGKQLVVGIVDRGERRRRRKSLTRKWRITGGKPTLILLAVLAIMPLKTSPPLLNLPLSLPLRRVVRKTLT